MGGKVQQKLLQALLTSMRARKKVGLRWRK